MTSTPKRLVVTLALILSTMGSLEGVAHGGVSCSFNMAQHKLSITFEAPAESVSLEVDNGNILNNDVSCAGATTTGTDKIVITDTSTGQQGSVVIDLSGGKFGPGFTNETGSSDEIEFVVDLGDGTNLFGLHGGSEANRFRIGRTKAGSAFRREVNANAGETLGIDHDIVVRGNLLVFNFQGGGGADTIKGTGGAGTGKPSIAGLGMDGQLGQDMIVGGKGADSLFGRQECSGNACLAFDQDVLVGGANADYLNGNAGSDLLRGGKGADFMRGESGNDTMLGNDGGDSLQGEAGDDDLNGGDGHDACTGGEGTDSVVNCEE